MFHRLRSGLQASNSIMEPIAAGAAATFIVCDVDEQHGLIEFPADDPDRACRFWSGLLDIELGERSQAEGRGWQSQSGAPVLGIHERGAAQATRPHFRISPFHMEAALEKVIALGGVSSRRPMVDMPGFEGSPLASLSPRGHSSSNRRPLLGDNTEPE